MRRPIEAEIYLLRAHVRVLPGAERRNPDLPPPAARGALTAAAMLLRREVRALGERPVAVLVAGAEVAPAVVVAAGEEGADEIQYRTQTHF